MVVGVGAVEVDHAEAGHQTPACRQVHHQFIATEEEADEADPLHSQVDILMKDTSVVTSTLVVADQGLDLPKTNTGINTDLDLPGTDIEIDIDRSRVPQ